MKNNLVKKSVVSLLVFVFLITPLTPVFADVLDPINPPSDPPTIQIPPPETPPPTNPPENPPVNPPPTEGEGKNPPGQPNSAIKNTTPVSPEKQIIPQPDPVTGALTYSYPISVPPGRNGLQSDLALQYNSQDNSQDSVFGYNWSINIPYITRVNKKGTNTLFSDNYFSSSLSGDLVNTSGNNYRAKVENGDFLKYTFDAGTWTAFDKTGTTYTFGSQSSSREDNGNSATIYKWMLETVQDANGNIITYTYTKDQNKIYPLNIHYAIFDINFSKEARPDALTSYASSFVITTAYRISQIQITASAITRNKYDLAYVAGDNNNRSILNTITQTGINDIGASTVVVPNTVFVNTKNVGLSFTGGAWAFPPNIEFSGGSLWGDLNGDGFPDILSSWTAANNTVVKSAYINNKDGTWAIAPEFLPPVAFAHLGYPAQNFGYQLQDLNGDGLADLFNSDKHDNYSSVESNIYINTGNGWVLSSSKMPAAISFGGGAIATLADLNGDGLTDLYLSAYGLSVPKSVYLNNGNFSWTNVTSSWFSDMDSSIGSWANFYMDVNGDGITDRTKIFFSYETPLYPTTHASVYIGTGTGDYINNPDYATIMAFSFYAGTNPGDLGVRLADLNGDGLPELIRSSSASGGSQNPIYLNTGHGWVLKSDWHLPLFFSDNFVGQSSMIDVNADGLLDMYSYNINSSFNVNNGTKPDALSIISYPQGAHTDITYNSSIKDTTSKIPFPLQTVESITTTEPVNNIATKDSYTYSNGYYFYDTNDVTTRKFAGFGVITKTDLSGNVIKTYFHQDDYFKFGKPYRIEQYDNASHLYAATLNKWDDVNLWSGNKFVKLAQTLSLTYDGNSAHKDSAESYTYNDSNGNLQQKIQYGEVAGNSSGTFSDVGSDKFTTDNLYATDGTYLVGLPYQTTTLDQNSNKVKESQFYYDSLALGDVSKGNMTRQKDWKSGINYIATQKTYNSYGLPLTSTDPENNTIQYSYDANNLYPTTITNPKLQDTNYNYDYATGQVTQKTDANGRVFQSVYDGLGRLLQEKQPDISSPLTLVLKTNYIYTDTPNAVSIVKSNYLDGSIVADNYTYFDGLGRKIQDRVEAEGSNFSAKDFAYNNVGQLAKESLPYFSSGGGKTSPTTTASLYTTYTYDAVNRPTNITNAVGTTSNGYNNWKLTTTDANGNAKDFYKDAYGNLVQVDEQNNGNIYSTFYNYNYLGNLTKLTDAAQNIRNFSYDGLGRKLTAQDLHAPADSTFGTWNYAYDDVGNLTQTVDPKNQTVNYTYDSLNRPLTENYTGATGTEVTCTYDSGVGGIGHLTSETNSAITKNYTYNALGLPKQETSTLGGDDYATSYNYDRQGNQTLITNPDDSQVKYLYNSAGLLDQVQGIVTNFDYSPTGQIALQSDANGTIATNTYDATKLYRLSSKITTDSANTHLQDVSYIYDNVGNITQLTDASATDSAKTVSYTYDNLYRLLSATATNVATGQTPYAQTYAYNPIGNILTNSTNSGTSIPPTANPAFLLNQGSYAYSGTGYANPHAVTSIGSLRTFYYDKNGNLLDSSGSVLPVDPSEYQFPNTWDYKNRLTKTQGAHLVTFGYDPENQRVKLTTQGVTTYYPTKFYNTDGTTITKHIFANGQDVATVTGTGSSATINYTSTDSLNSSSVITDSTGAIAETLDYLPFGGIRIDSKTGGFSEQRKYIGQEFDKSTGLNYLNARYYDSGIGKFISEDPVFLSIGDVNQIKQLTGKSQQEILSDPQNLNSYSYANNNPIVNSDPTGKNIFLLAAVMLFGDPMTETPNSMEFDPSGNHGQSGKNLQASLFAASFLVPGGAEEKGLAKGANFISKEGAQMVKNKIADIAEKIGSGHAYDKHLVNEGLFKGIANTKEELVNHVENVMSRPDRVENLGNGITAYGQEKTNTIVIHNPYGENLGTVYQNKNIQNKMNNLIKGSK